MNEENKIPLPGQPEPTPDFLQGDDWFSNNVEPYLLDFREAYKPPRYTLSWKGIPFAPLGGIHNITGQSGNGKTMTLAQFMATILCGEFGQLRYELTDVEPRILYVDTEMEKDNTIAVKNRVLTMAGRDINGQYDDFRSSCCVTWKRCNSSTKTASRYSTSMGDPYSSILPLCDGA